MANTITLSLGRKSYEIVDAEGNSIGTLRFNPSDPTILGKLKAAEKEIESAVEELRERDDPEALLELDAQVTASLVAVFGEDIRTMLNGVSTIAFCEDGRIVVEHLLEVLSPIVYEAQKKAMEDSQARVDKYTKKYTDAPKEAL